MEHEDNQKGQGTGRFRHAHGMVLGGGLTAVSGLEPDSELLVWIALRRVHAGGVAKVAGCWLDAGRPVPGYLTDTLDDLTGTGLVALAAGGPHGPLRRASLTGGGQVRYAAALQRHGGPTVPTDLRPGPTPDTEEDMT